MRVVYARYVRRLGTIADGDPYFLVPVSIRVHLGSKCMARKKRSERARQRRLARRVERTIVLCLDDFENGGGDYCVPAASAIAGRLFASADGPEPPDGSTDIPVSVSALAPDGAATLEAHYPDHTLTAQVAGNFATLLHTVHVDPDAKRFPNFNPKSAIFRRADGTVLLLSHPPVDDPSFGD